MKPLLEKTYCILLPMVVGLLVWIVVQISSLEATSLRVQRNAEIYTDTKVEGLARDIRSRLDQVQERQLEILVLVERSLNKP